MGTLDYIFYSTEPDLGLRLKAVLAVPPKEQVSRGVMKPEVV